MLRLYFPALKPCVVLSAHSPVVLPGLSARKCGIVNSASHHLALSPFHPSFLSSPLLPVWMNVSSFTPLLLDFHTVRFPGSSGYFLFFNLLLFFFWLYEGQSVSTYSCILSGSLLSNSINYLTHLHKAPSQVAEEFCLGEWHQLLTVLHGVQFQ